LQGSDRNCRSLFPPGPEREHEGGRGERIERVLGVMNFTLRVCKLVASDG
jgi:hypothetical protein